MFNDFEIKLHKDDNWCLRYLHVYHGISISDSENEYKKGKKITIPNDSKFNITKEKTPSGEEFYVLNISAKDIEVFVRAQQKICLEYIIYNSEQKNEKDMGRPMTFVPHLSNIDSVLYETRINNFHFKGLINLVVVALIVSHIRLMYDNFVKTGLMISKDTVLGLLTSSSFYYFMFVNTVLVISIITCFTIEKLASIIKNENIVSALNFLNFSFILSTPFLLKYYNFYDPVTGQLCLTLVSIVFLKLYSFSHFWLDVRKFIYKRKAYKSELVKRKSINTELIEKISEIKNSSDLSKTEKEKKIKELENIDSEEFNQLKKSIIETKDEKNSSIYEEIESIITEYPNNLSFWKLFVFLFMPVLCFQYKYPRTSKIRISYLLNYGVKIIICTFLQ